MFLKSTNLKHHEQSLHKALGVNDDILVQCRERIFFCHFANALRVKEFYPLDSDAAPKELTTVTGDLQSCLKMIDNNTEYEITLLLFMGYHRIASKAFAEYEMQNDSALSSEDKVKLELFNLLVKLKQLKDKEEASDDDDNDDLNAELANIDNVVKRVQKVKESNYSFPRYMDAMGYKTITYNGVDDILRSLFPEK